MDQKQQTSRRDFMKTSTVAAVGAGVLGSIGAAPRAYADGTETIRVGLVGCGGRGTGAAVQALSTEGNVKLVAMADAFRDRLDSSYTNITKQMKDQPERVAVDEEHKFDGFDGYKKVLDSDIDLIILATPPGFRPIHFEAAVNAGKHVFMEKPCAVDGPGIRKLLAAIEVSKKKNLKVGVGLQRHHQPHYIETVEALQNGVIGDILAYRCYWNGGGVWDPRKSREECKSEMEYQMRNWYYYVWLCGDHICEQHIHNLDVCNWIKNDVPVKAYGMGGRQVRTDKKYGEIYDHFAVEYEYGDGIRMYSQCRHIRNCWNSVTEHVQGAKGHADVSGGKIITGSETWNAPSKSNRKIRGNSKSTTNNPYQIEHDDLQAAIRNNTPYNEGDYGASSTMTAILGRMATYSGKPVSYEEALNSKIDLMPKEFTWEASPVSVPDADGYYPIPQPGTAKAF